MDVQKILRMREAGHVQRCHCMQHHGSYDVAQHTFHMLVLLMALHPDPTLELYEAIMTHDMAERWTGDSPAVIKRSLPDFKTALSEAEEFVLKKTGIMFSGCDPDGWIRALDNIEFLMWCDDQIGLGNVGVKGKRKEVENWFMENFNSLPGECREFMKRYEWQRTADSLE